MCRSLTSRFGMQEQELVDSYPLSSIEDVSTWIIRGEKRKGRRIRRFEWVGGGVTPAVLPHHRTYGSVYGGSRSHPQSSMP